MKTWRKSNIVAIMVLIVLVGIICATLIRISINTTRFLYTPEPATVIILPSKTNTPESTQTPTKTPTQIPTATRTLMLTQTFTAFPYPTEIIDANGVEMVLVPAGEFIMGDNNGQEDEKPAHRVYLDAFYIDVYEVTNKRYQDCVNAGMCQPPVTMSSETRSSYFGNPKYDNYPVIYVSWNMSKTYCEWRSAGLPTEAQWEKAARGIDERKYPWGSERPDCSKVNFLDLSTGNCVGDTTAVGSYENGKSPYGVYDMGGNVWEWIADWYSETYYQNSPVSNPTGPDVGQFRMSRGGGWYGQDNHLYTYGRHVSLNPYPHGYHDSGFRCAKDATP